MNCTELREEAYMIFDDLNTNDVDEFINLGDAINSDVHAHITVVCDKNYDE
jgi:hypothetical protein